jgi:hypothetical protein
MMRVNPETLDEETTEHVIDMVAKALFARNDTSEVVVTWDELEKASSMKCEIEKHSGGVTLRRQS